MAIHCRAVKNSLCGTGINNTGGKFATGTTGVIDISEKPGQKIQNFDGLGLKSPF